VTGAPSFDPRSLADPSWFTNSANDCLLVEAYEITMAPDAISRKFFRFQEIVIAIKTARLEFIELQNTQLKFLKNRQIKVNADHRISTTDISPKLITVQPFDSKNPNHEAELLDRSSEYISLLISTNSKNIAFRRLFRQVIGYRDQYLSVAGNAIRLPFDLPPPDLTEQAFFRFSKCQESIKALPDDQRQKTQLSLHWHIKGIQSDGLDSFLCLWIAIETLSMKTANVAGTNDTLGKIYGISRSDAAAEFGIGRIQGLRSRMVHHGYRKAISTDLIDYMECIFSDLILHLLIGSAEKRSRNFLAEKKINIQKLTD
jgi:hypothetical protein